VLNRQKRDAGVHVLDAKCMDNVTKIHCVGSVTAQGNAINCTTTGGTITKEGNKIKISCPIHNESQDWFTCEARSNGTVFCNHEAVAF
jgi:hypothetical protein